MDAIETIKQTMKRLTHLVTYIVLISSLVLIQKGEWNGRQLIPAEWVAEMSKKQVESINPGTRMEEAEGKGMTKDTSDWMQGYGYQMWRCRPGCIRARRMLTTASGARRCARFIETCPKRSWYSCSRVRTGGPQRT